MKHFIESVLPPGPQAAPIVKQDYFTTEDSGFFTTEGTAVFFTTEGTEDTEGFYHRGHRGHGVLASMPFVPSVAVVNSSRVQ